MSQYAEDNPYSEDWLIGNEVNNRIWNYMAWTDWDTYIREYEQVFRVAYNTIKSENANAHVYICLEQDWDRNRPTSHQEYYEYIDAKDFIQKFNENIRKTGNIDWGVSEHPYIEQIIYLTNSPDYGFNFTGIAKEVYENIEGPNEAVYDEWARAVIGISDWSQVLR